MRFSPATIASDAITNNINAKEYNQLNENRNNAPPIAIKHKPEANVLKASRSYFCGFADLITANAIVQQPESAKIIGTNRNQPMIPATANYIPITKMTRKTPILKS